MYKDITIKNKNYPKLDNRLFENLSINFIKDELVIMGIWIGVFFALIIINYIALRKFHFFIGDY